MLLFACFLVVLAVVCCCCYMLCSSKMFSAVIPLFSGLSMFLLFDVVRYCMFFVGGLNASI